MPLGNDKINLECREGPEARKKFGGGPRPRWFARILLVCPDNLLERFDDLDRFLQLGVPAFPQRLS